MRKAAYLASTALTQFTVRELEGEMQELRKFKQLPAPAAAQQ